MRRLFLILISCLLLCVAASASQITTLQTKAEVQPDGSCNMTVEAELVLDETVDTIAVPLGYHAKNAQIDGEEAQIAQDKDGFSYITLNGAFEGKRSIRATYTLAANIAPAEEGISWTLALLPGHWSWHRC